MNVHKTTLGEKFLISAIRNVTQFMIYVSQIGIEALACFNTWNYDGKFHSAPKLFYQNNIIHGLYHDKRNVPCVYSSLRDKILKLY